MSVTIYAFISILLTKAFANLCDYSSPWQDWTLKSKGPASLSIQSECLPKNPFHLNLEVLSVSENSNMIRSICPDKKRDKTRIGSFRMIENKNKFIKFRTLGSMSTSFGIECNKKCSVVKPKDCNCNDYTILNEKTNYNNLDTNLKETCYSFHVKKTSTFDCYLNPATFINIPIHHEKLCNPSTTRGESDEKRKKLNIKLNKKEKAQFVFNFGHRRLFNDEMFNCPCQGERSLKDIISWIETPLGTFNKKSYKLNNDSIDILVDSKLFIDGIYPIVLCFNGGDLGQDKRNNVTYTFNNRNKTQNKFIGKSNTPNLCKMDETKNCSKYNGMYEMCSANGCCYCDNKCTNENEFKNCELTCEQLKKEKINVIKTTKTTTHKPNRRFRRMMNNSQKVCKKCEKPTKINMKTIMFKSRENIELYSSKSNLLNRLNYTDIFKVNKNTLKHYLNLSEWCYEKEGNRLVFELLLQSNTKGYNKYTISNAKQLFAQSIKSANFMTTENKYKYVIINNIFFMVLPKYGVVDNKKFVDIDVDINKMNDHIIIRFSIPYHTNFNYESLLYIIRRSNENGWTIYPENMDHSLLPSFEGSSKRFMSFFYFYLIMFFFFNVM